MTDERRSRRERSTQQKGIFSRMFTPDEGSDETTTYSSEEMGVRELDRPRDQRQGFTVERAAEIIRELPPEVPRQSAYRIVRQTLLAAGIDIESLESSTRARESKLDSEIELSRQRLQDLEARTKEVVSSLEEQIRKAREARDYAVREEEGKISRARESLEDIEKVRDFFGLPEEEEASGEAVPGEAASGADDTTTSDASEVAGEETQVMERADQDDTQILRPRGPLSREWDTRKDQGARGS
jgi:hypothetical protein